jgi:UDP-N-acetylglucosamine 2-epimerase (non-hydrolysing)
MTQVNGKCRIHLVAGTRPNIVKVAPLYTCLRVQDWCEPSFIWFTQHFTPELAAENLEDLGIHAADHTIEVAQAGFGARLGSMISGYADCLDAARPDVVVVAGDVDTTLGAALAAKRQGIPVVHLEAGLRSYDSAMPEEINRILIDSISDIWLAPSEAASQNLILHEGRAPEKVHFVGNIMIDSLRKTLSADVQDAMMARFRVTRNAFGLATFHRPGNVDSPERLAWLLDVLAEASEQHPVIFPLHPRTRAMLDRHAMMDRLQAMPAIRLAGPIRYRNFVNLLAASRFVLTDSGGLQEEAAFLRKFCFTLRDSTERPVTLHCGSNQLVNYETINPVMKLVLSAPGGAEMIQHIPLWDGLTAERCAHILKKWWGSTAAAR